MKLKPARLRGLRRLWCSMDGHRFYAVRKRWHEERFGRVRPNPFDVTEAILWDLADSLTACATCGQPGERLYTQPGSEFIHPDYPTWLPPRFRYGKLNQTCPVCLLRTYDRLLMRCESCGVTSESLCRAGIR